MSPADCRIERAICTPRNARVVCHCGAINTVDRDGGGTPELVTIRCSDDFRTRRLCSAQQVECADCGLLVCDEHRIDLSGRVLCRVCATAEMATDAELLEVA